MAAAATSRSFSQYGQDVFLADEVFHRKRDGFFVEIGAADGIALSNTKLFEDEYNWTGILIEPNPDEFARLVKNRPRATCVQAAVYSDDVETIDFRKITGYSMMLSGIEKAYDARHVRRIEHEISSVGGSFEIIKVPARTLKTICEAQKVTTIDLLCIDVEGAELDILRSIDFEAVDIRVLLVEDNYNELAAFVELLEPHGFKCMCKKGADLVFVHD